MKANAPEKIFLEWYEIGDKKYCDWCIIPRTNNESVEYTRTNAFIEKAIEWLRNCLDNGLWVANDVGETEKEAIIEHFKKAMKL